MPEAVMVTMKSTQDARFLPYSICTIASPLASVRAEPTILMATSALRGSSSPFQFRSSWRPLSGGAALPALNVGASRTPLRLTSSLGQAGLVVGPVVAHAGGLPAAL